MKIRRSIGFVVVACALSAGPLRGALAAPEVAAFTRDFYAAYNAAGASRLAGFYAEDATLVDPSFELNLKGREQIGKVLVAVLAKYDTLGHEIAHTTISGDDLIVEGTMVGKLGAKVVRVPFVSIFHFTDGKIAAQRDLFDTLHFMVQLGAFPSPFQAAPKAG